MELWDIYDENRVKKPGVMQRGDAFREGDYHLVVHVCVFNEKNEMLIQKRQPFKSGFSGLWDVTVGGSAVMGDTSRSAAERELYEEVGIRIDLSQVRPHMTVNYDHGFDDFYLVEKNDIDLASLKLQYEEVEAVKWASEAEIIDMMREGSFIPYYESLIRLFFAMRGRYSAHVPGTV
jgi:isopentenyldiphosphate isomerase